MNKIERFMEYAQAFERVYTSDDWSLLAPYFTEDAVYEVTGSGEFDGRYGPRDVLFSSLKSVLDRFDRRFDERSVEVVAGPEERDGAVWLGWQATYKRAGLPPLVIKGEEIARFDDDAQRIAILEDHYAPAEAAEMSRFLADHADELGA